MKLIIQAMGSSRYLSEFDGEVWSVNNGFRQIAQQKGKLHKLFLAHKLDERYPDGTLIFHKPDFELLINHDVEIYNIHRNQIKGMKIYPLKKVSERFGTEFFTNTICYMLAYAFYLSTDKNLKIMDNAYNPIYLYGCDMLTMGEYQLEKGGVEYWIGRGQGMGFDIRISEGSNLCVTPTGLPYGMIKQMLNDEELAERAMQESMDKIKKAIEVKNVNNR